MPNKEFPHLFFLFLSTSCHPLCALFPSPHKKNKRETDGTRRASTRVSFSNLISNSMLFYLCHFVAPAWGSHNGACDGTEGNTTASSNNAWRWSSDVTDRNSQVNKNSIPTMSVTTRCRGPVIDWFVRFLQIVVSQLAEGMKQAFQLSFAKIAC